MTACSAQETTHSASRAGDDVSGNSHPPQGSGEAEGADPSMEDILASIRRILNEDEATPGSQSEADSTASEGTVTPTVPEVTIAEGHAGDDGVLVLDEAMLVAMPSTEHEVPPVPVITQTAPGAVQSSGVSAEHDGLMGPDSAAAATASVGSLLRSLSSERATQVHRNGPTIEDLVREEIRPLLKTWLDLHLPPLVERVVRQEIERLAGRAND
jgi:cell pole-organizing protein PopZ